ncbi:MAG: HipA domain-containing protein [Aeromicrobium sp.]|uniref:HipA domain-containing protein n=1 Tax=Aeromicrobium sp. TaxID=1871063 RepID=UPI0039E3AA36
MNPGHTAPVIGDTGPRRLSPPYDEVFLDNLLPDDPEVRRRWARERGLTSDDPATLLAEFGEDAAGSYVRTGERTEASPLVEATEADIAARIAALATDDTAWLPPDVRTRFTLAGAQGKFTLTRIDGQWFWPTAEHASTHIVKPPSQRHRRIEVFEHASLELARTVGLEASHSKVTTFHGRPAFVVERWDRHDGQRLPAVDLNQALGRPTADKYRVTAPEVARFLAPLGLAGDFVRQLAFNTAMGNADAHAKNYSLLLDREQPRLAPLYDTVPVYFWPAYDHRFAMPVGKARRPMDLTVRNWRLFAEHSGLPADDVLHQAFTVMRDVAEHYEDVFAPHADSTRMRLIAKQVRVLRRVIRDSGVMRDL